MGYTTWGMPRMSIDDALRHLRGSVSTASRSP